MTTNARSKTSPVSTLAHPAASFPISSKRASVAPSPHPRVSDWWERPPATAGAVHFSLTADRDSETMAASRRGRVSSAVGHGGSFGAPELSGAQQPSGSARNDSGRALATRTGAPTRLEHQRPYTPRSRVLALVGITLSLLLGGFGIANASSSPKNYVRSYVVRPGDSFWSIARTVRSTGDVRPLVAELIQAHGSSSLQVGDRVEIPSA
jgi:hypothetical protein